MLRRTIQTLALLVAIAAALAGEFVRLQAATMLKAHIWRFCRSCFGRVEVAPECRANVSAWRADSRAGVTFRLRATRLASRISVGCREDATCPCAWAAP